MEVLTLQEKGSKQHAAKHGDHHSKFSNPCLGLAVMGIFPSVSGVMAGIAAQLPAVVAAYFYEPISYFAILGIAGTYMGFLSGNVNNMRAPCASIAQSAANVEEGSDEGGIIATVGIAVSIFINIAFLTVCVIVGNYVVSLLPQHVLDALTYCSRLCLAHSLQIKL